MLGTGGRGRDFGVSQAQLEEHPERPRGWMPGLRTVWDPHVLGAHTKDLRVGEDCEDVLAGNKRAEALSGGADRLELGVVFVHLVVRPGKLGKDGVGNVVKDRVEALADVGQRSEEVLPAGPGLYGRRNPQIPRRLA